jgi:hypothetical protein
VELAVSRPLADAVIAGKAPAGSTVDLAIEGGAVVLRFEGGDG